MSVTLDEAIRALPEILERLERIETQNVELKALLQGAQPETVRKGYDVNDLKARGYGERQARYILRTHGLKAAGRRYRITHEKLIELENKGEGNGNG